jgi:hypothetical protein
MGYVNIFFDWKYVFKKKSKKQNAPMRQELKTETTGTQKNMQYFVYPVVAKERDWVY